MNFRRGKLPADPEAIKLRFGAYFHGAELPAVPKVIGRPYLIKVWRMLANDFAGDCVQAGAAHETMLLRADAEEEIPTFTNRNVLDDYLAVNPGDTHYSHGTAVGTYAAYRQKTGIVDGEGNRHKIDVYAGLRPGDVDELALAVSLFGVVGVGVALPSNAETQFNYGEPWSVDPDSTNSGGHYIACVGRNSQGNFLVVTWGRLHAATPDWIKTYMDEGLAIFSRERLNAKGYSPQGYDADKLNDDFTQVTA